jgi:spore maturation protein CgeB
MTDHPLRFVVIGLSITSSWGNGHATTYRGLLRELAARGHHVLFLERDVPWYAAHRDMPAPTFCETRLYTSLAELKRRHTGAVRTADVVIVGSFVPEGTAIGHWVTRTARGLTAFYDIDTPVTLARLEAGDHDYLEPALVSRYQLYLSFTGGPTLDRLERVYGSPAARALYCSVDAELYYPEPASSMSWDLGYMGTYSEDRQRALQRLLLDSASRWPGGRFIVAGPQYPPDVVWRSNVERIEHLPPDRHRSFYCGQRFTLNLTRAAMVRSGYSPSVRLFEAAACGTPIISDVWDGLDTLFEEGREVLVARSARTVIDWLVDMPEDERHSIGAAARARVLSAHTAAHRALELETCARQALSIMPAA